MSLTLYSFEGDFRAYKAQIAAAYNGVALTYSKVDVSDERSPAMLARSPVGKVPILETDQGSIFESNAIARYVARLRRDTELQGVSFFESGQVDSWVDFCSHELELPLTMWLYPVLGYTSYNKATHSKSVAEARRALELLESHLLLRTYLVGEKVTLADIVLVSALLYPMKFLFSPEFLAPFPCVNRWFQTCVNQPEFKSVVGPFVPCTEEMVAPGGVAGTTFASTSGKAAKAGKAKAGKKDKAAKKAEKKEPEPEAAPAPAPAPAKPADPFAGLAKSPMNMDAWKREYSNSRPAYYSSMEYFWKNFDKDGYSLWWCTYQYNSENTVGFMTSNLVGGFIQRSDAVRKHAFGSMVIFGGETAPAGGYVIEGCWLMRGHSIQPMIDNNPDAEYYTWTQIDSTDEKQRERIGHFWCAESEIDGKALFDSSIFK